VLVPLEVDELVDVTDALIVMDGESVLVSVPVSEGAAPTVTEAVGECEIDLERLNVVDGVVLDVDVPVTVLLPVEVPLALIVDDNEIEVEPVGVLEIDAESVDVILALTEPDILTSELTDADVKGENEVACVAALDTIADTVIEVDADREAIALVELDTIADTVTEFVALVELDTIADTVTEFVAVEELDTIDVTEVLDEREATAVLVLDATAVSEVNADADTVAIDVTEALAVAVAEADAESVGIEGFADMLAVIVKAIVTEGSLLCVGLLDMLQVFVIVTETEEDVQPVTEVENKVDGLVLAEMLFATVVLPTLDLDTKTDGLAVVLVDSDTEIDGLADELVLGLHV
jgi:hypothetical protein